MTSMPPLGTLTSLMAGSDTVQKAVDAVTGGAGAVSKPVVRIVIVIVGLLLIAAGLFQFKPVQETMGAAGKTAAAAL